MYKNAEVNMVLCPYNPAHTVSKLRLQKHITKCMEKYPDVKLVSCFYNYSHRFKPEDMLSHYEVCCNKTRLDNSNYELTSYSSCGSSKKSDDCREEFPNITAKPKFFTTRKYYPDERFDKLLSSSRSGKNSQIDKQENDLMMDNSDSDDSNDELEPLPLPKTTSKAFVFPKNEASGIKSEGISSGFGRAKNLFSAIKEPPGLTLQQFKNFENDKQHEKKSFRFPPMASCSASVTSSMFDDNTTLQSESIIFAESISEVNSDAEFVLKNFNKFTKI